jgi:hypothetical protein
MTQKEEYLHGFVKKCAEVNIDAGKLLKFAKMMEPAPTPAEKEKFKAGVKAKKAPAAKTLGPIAKNLTMKKELLKD